MKWYVLVLIREELKNNDAKNYQKEMNSYIFGYEVEELETKKKKTKNTSK